MKLNFALIAACAGLFLAGCATQPERKEAAQKEAPAPAPAPPAEEGRKEAEPAKPETGVVNVRFATTRGDFVVAVHKDWAPLGAARFLDLVKAKYYDDSGFFRVVPNFVVQFGLAADPAVTKKWDRPFKDDPVIRTNKRGSLVFATAGPNTRTTQLFINLRSNQMLDSQGFAPFGEVTAGGMTVVDAIYAGHGEMPDQDAITRRGSAYLKPTFPKLDYIKTARIVE